MKLTQDALFLAAGAMGLGLAAFGAIGAPRFDALGLGAAATVDGRAIPREAVARAVEALSNDKRNAVTPADEAAALERLIEEELLIQRGIELGLAETDLAARKAIVQSVLQLAIAERAGTAPTDAELRRFHAENEAMFTPAPRVRATLVFVARQNAARLTEAERALKAGRIPPSDPVALELPQAPLAPAELRTYLGATLAARVLEAQTDEVVRADDTDGWRLVRIDAVEPRKVASFEDVAGEVRAEWDRRADEAAVRAYIERLKRRARITRGA